MSKQSEIYEKKAKICKELEAFLEEKQYSSEDLKTLNGILYSKIKYSNQGDK